MTTPNGTPSQAKQLPNRPPSSDASVQAAALKSEARVRGTDQDQTTSGAPDAASGESTLKGGIANAQGRPFTGQA